MTRSTAEILDEMDEPTPADLAEMSVYIDDEDMDEEDEEEDDDMGEEEDAFVRMQKGKREYDEGMDE